MKVILASQSKARKDLMDTLKIDYDVIVSHADETLEPGLTICQQAEKLSYIKAKTVLDQTKGDRIVIGSDTMLCKDNKLYGKPKTEEQAKLFLSEFSGQKIQLVTGLTVLVSQQEQTQEYITSELATIYFKPMDEQDINLIIEKDNPYDGAGAYKIEGFAGALTQKVEGNYATILGLPIHLVYEILKKYQIFPKKHIDRSHKKC